MVMLQTGLPKSSQAKGQLAFASGAGLCRQQCWLCEPNCSWVLLGCSNLPCSLSLLCHLPRAPHVLPALIPPGKWSSSSSPSPKPMWVQPQEAPRATRPQDSFSSPSHSCSSPLPTGAKGLGESDPHPQGTPTTPPRSPLVFGSTSLALTQDNLA